MEAKQVQHKGGTSAPNRRKMLSAIVVLLAVGMVACTMDIGGEGSSRPTVEIISPASGSRVAPGQELEVQYRATDSIAIVRVELEVERQIVDLQNSPTAEGQPSLSGILRWTPTTAGVHTLLVYAYNRDGVSSDGVGVEIIVGEGGAPEATATQVGEVPTEPMATVVLSDDFSDPSSGWAVSSEETYRLGYEGGEYLIEHIQRNDASRWQTYSDQTFSDFVAEVEARFESEDEFVGAALIWRWQDNDNFYRFRVRNTGEYDLVKRVGGEWQTLISATSSPHINSGIATNKLGVTAAGDLIQIYVNDQHLADFNDSSFARGRIGFYASVYTASPVTTRILFDNLRVFVGQEGAAITPTELAVATPASYLPPSGKIVFASNRDSPEDIYKEIYVMNVDGSGLKRLTNYEFDDAMPCWSPDGRRIAFVSWRDGNWEIYIMNSDGSAVTRLTDDPASDLGPRWSSDGQRIVFYSDRDGNQEIYLMAADGSGQVNVSNNPARDRVADWSPDGEWIAFSSDRGGDEDVYVMREDGSEVINLTRNPAKDYAPSWAPDGQRIVFESDRRAEGNPDIYVMYSDGSGVVRLTDYPQSDSAAGWSPDGMYIHFGREVSGVQGRWQMYIMRADGSEQTDISKDPSATYRDRDWSAGP